MRTTHRTPQFRRQKSVSFAKEKFYWFTLCVFFLFTALVLKLIEPKLFPFNHVEIHTDSSEINTRFARKLIEKKIKGFFLTDMLDIKMQLSTLPNIDNINLKRVWPDKLVINMTTQKLVGKWGRECAITSRGFVVPKNISDTTLPAFSGPQDQSYSMLEKFKLMSDQLKTLGLHISKVELNDRRSWQVQLNNGVQLMLGRKDVDNRFMRFVSVWPKLNHVHHGKIAVVDLRYANGIAVRPLYTKEKSAGLE